jgi:hypothetical protein
MASSTTGTQFAAPPEERSFPTATYSMARNAVKIRQQKTLFYGAFCRRPGGPLCSGSVYSRVSSRLRQRDTCQPLAGLNLLFLRPRIQAGRRRRRISYFFPGQSSALFPQKAYPPVREPQLPYEPNA